ncbi:MAG: xanthine dehydrogenase accessory protein XdhC [Tabrizicola sp.]|nr:xanthine dehydrogenase accessory protein XdhC [Tabrizicola sp.]
MFDLTALAEALKAHGRIARVVIAAHDGSSPREIGAAMLVWDTGQSGTIGGGALEFEAAERARAMLSGASRAVDRVALGPSLGQCCGGAVTLWTEVFDAVPVPEAGVIARGAGEMPLAVKRMLAAARGQGLRPAASLVSGWLVEPVAEAERQVWVWGAGHVGRALVSVLAPLPGLAVTWIDVAAERFPDLVPDNVTVVPASDPAVLADHAPAMAEHLILTYSHALDLELCHRLLSRGFRSCGLIGSATKWARFRSRLKALGHEASVIGRIRCPIGDPALGKHPQAIAVGVAAELLKTPRMAVKEKRA